MTLKMVYNAVPKPVTVSKNNKFKQVSFSHFFSFEAQHGLLWYLQFFSYSV